MMDRLTGFVGAVPRVSHQEFLPITQYGGMQKSDATRLATDAMRAALPATITVTLENGAGDRSIPVMPPASVGTRKRLEAARR